MRVEPRLTGQRAASIVADDTNTHVQDHARSTFFFGMSILLMSLVLVGFGPTLYFRPFFDVPPIPGYLYLHGWILTGWYVLLVAQTSLIQTARAPIHRRLGILGALLGVLVVVGGQIATLNMVERVASLGVDLDATVGGVSVAAVLSGAVWSSIESSYEFAILVATAVLLRRRPEAHKRLMLLASILSVGAAVNRIADWQILGGGGSTSPIPFGPFGPIAMWLLVAALVAHDLMTVRRVHVATLVGGALVVLHTFGLPSGLIASSELGVAFTRSLQ